MGQITQTNNYERTKKLGRPKGTGILTDEENKERARQRSMLYYSLNVEKERERKRSEYVTKHNELITVTVFWFLLFPSKQLANYIYIIREVQIYTHWLGSSD